MIPIKWFNNDLHCSKEISDFLLKLSYGAKEISKIRETAFELYMRSLGNDR